MTNQIKTLIGWLATITTIPVYQEPVPMDSTLPYVSISANLTRNYGADAIQSLTIWTEYTETFAPAYLIADKIDTALGETGVVVNGTDCKLWIKKGSPFAQNRNDSEKFYRGVYINLQIAYY